ncbi:MAG: peptidylprolyl isomerase, partial [Planctomycetes bacterium]|nr:peptidylprolyl isomerase [Planctomycetota bacterium]
ANECLKRYGEEVLESLIHRQLIRQECQRRGIGVTGAEVNDEIKQMAERFSLPVDHWLKMLSQERGISPKQYANDIVWPMLALRKLAGQELEVTHEELVEHYERQYGEAVKARMIVCDNRQTAESVRAAAVANPDQFGKLAREQSIDAPSASLEGRIQPIRKHTGPPGLEAAAFQMRDGEISQLIQVGNQFVLLKREGVQPALRVAFEQVKMGMVEAIRDGKMRRVAGQVFRQLKDEAVVQNVLTNPALSQQMPGIAATVNDAKITIRELAEVCMERYGEEVLEGTINRRILEQSLKRRNLLVSEADIDREVARAAARLLPLRPDGSPDVEKWLAMVTEQQEISVDLYRNDTVWPSMALKKLVGERAEVTEEDLKRGYEAYYGPRVRCLAIVMDDLRRAQKVWEMARANPTEDFFGDLAEQYSVDPSSKALRGEVPPIQQHGGQPELEKEAFALAPAQLSSIVQVGTGKFVILYCQERTKPVQVDYATVRDEIYADVHEKKMRIAMAEQFEKLQELATVDNYLTGAVRSPTKSGDAMRTATRPASTQKSVPRR